MAPSPAHTGDLPIVFVHGHGDSAALWHTTLWRFESNGYDPSRLLPIDFVKPAAPTDDHITEPNRGTTTEHRAQLAAAVSRALQRTGHDELVLVGASRGGNAIRHYIRYAGDRARVSLAILCGTPSHGIFTAEDALGSEWNSRGRFLTGLNAGAEVAPHVRFVTIRSDRNDTCAQPPGEPDAFGRVIGTGYDSPALRGARNVVLDGLDHREVAFHRRAFAELYRAITDRAPDTLDIVPEPRVSLAGVVSGYDNGEATNVPLVAARVVVYRVNPDTGIRLADALHVSETGADGVWGPLTGSPSAFYEFVVSAEGYPTLHVYRTPFPRSSQYVHLRLEPVPEAFRDAASLVTMTRPRGYFGHGRDTFSLDGWLPDGVEVGVPTTSRATATFPAAPSRPVPVVFNDETLTVRTQPLADGHLVFAEFHY